MSVLQENTNTVEVAAPGTFVAPRVVRVNLVPAEIHEAQSRRRVQLAGLGIVLLGVAAGVGLYLHAAGQLSDAKDSLAQEQATNASLQAEKGRLGDVTKVNTQFAAATALHASVTAPRISFSQYLTDLQLVTPSTSWLTSVTFTEDLTKLTVGGASTVPTPGAARPTVSGPVDVSTLGGTVTAGAPGYPAIDVVATVTASGQAVDLNDVAAVIDGISRLNGDAHTVLTAAAVADQGVKVSAAAGLPGNTLYPVTYTLTSSLTPDAFDVQRLTKAQAAPPVRSNRVWLVGGAGVALLVVLASYLLFTKSKTNEATETKEQTSTVQAQNAQLRADLASLNAQKGQLQNKQASIAAVGKEVPDDPETAGLIRTLRRAADDSDVVITSITPAAPVVANPLFPQSAPYSSITLNVVAQGEYTGLKLFLSNIETLQRVVVPVTVTLAQNPAQSGGQASGTAASGRHVYPLTLSMEARTYTTDTAVTDPVQLPQLQATATPSATATP